MKTASVLLIVITLTMLTTFSPAQSPTASEPAATATKVVVPQVIKGAITKEKKVDQSAQMSPSEARAKQPGFGQEVKSQGIGTPISPDGATMRPNGASKSEPATATLQLPVIVNVIDVSGSLSRSLPQLKSIAEEVYKAAPDGSRFGLVTFATEARKQMFADRAEAVAAIQSLKVARRGYSDFNRATDAALSLIQAAGESIPTLVCYLTDGKVDLPSDFVDRSNFIDLLRREFSSRPGIRVMVVNVNGGKAIAGTDTLPANVAIYPVSDWAAAQAEVAGRLAPQIKVQMTQKAAPSPAATSPAPSAQQRQPSSKRGLVTIVMVIAIAVSVVAMVWRRRRRSSKRDARDQAAPDNLISIVELEVPSVKDTEPQPVALIEIRETIQSTPQYCKMEINDRFIFGKDGDLRLPGLHQSQTMELRFVMKDRTPALVAYRLRPDAPSLLDSIKVNEKPAPPVFDLRSGDTLLINQFSLTVILTDEEQAALLAGDIDEHATLIMGTLHSSQYSPSGDVTSAAATPTSFGADDRPISLRRRRHS